MGGGAVNLRIFCTDQQAVIHNGVHGDAIAAIGQKIIFHCL